MVKKPQVETSTSFLSKLCWTVFNLPDGHRSIYLASEAGIRPFSFVLVDSCSGVNNRQQQLPSRTIFLNCHEPIYSNSASWQLGSYSVADVNIHHSFQTHALLLLCPTQTVQLNWAKLLVCFHPVAAGAVLLELVGLWSEHSRYHTGELTEMKRPFLVFAE